MQQQTARFASYQAGATRGTLLMGLVLTFPWPALHYWIGLVPAVLVAGLALNALVNGFEWSAGHCWTCGLAWSAFATYGAYRLVLTYDPFAGIYMPALPLWAAPALLAALGGGAISWGLRRLIPADDLIEVESSINTLESSEWTTARAGERSNQ